MWPKLSNIDNNITASLKNYSTADKASELNSWIRIFSGAVKDDLKGLILQSNTDSRLIRATGETTTTIYGDSQNSGIMGKTWDDIPVESNSTRFLRPSPIVTGFSSKEGQDQISRDATLQLTAYTLEQMEEIQNYFLEPGYSLFIEWGWNTDDGYSGYTKTRNDKGELLSAQTIVEEIAKKSLNWQDLSRTRLNANGQYDAFLGFIVGGSVTSAGDTFNIEVRLKGEPSLPTYLQGYRNSKQLTPDGDVVVATDKVDTLFSPEQIEDDEITDGTSIAKRRFRYMFNELPSDKQLKKIAKLEDEVTFNQFINFDKAVENKIIDSLDNIFVSSTAELEGLELKKEDFFSKNRYIRMDLAVKILNILGKRDTFVIGGKRVSFKIDIEDTVIGGFPTMFSTNANKLVIPGKVPDFMQYFLEGGSVTQNKDGSLEKDNEAESGPFPPDIFDKGLEPFLGIKELKGEYSEQPGYYGYLKYLFINFDVFKSNLNKKIVNSREVFISMLNELSSAVNAFWKFQVVEGEFKKQGLSVEELFERGQREEAFKLIDAKVEEEGDVILTVIDENFVGELSDDFEKGIAEFQHNGLNSIFLNANLDLSLPASMVGQIVNERLGTSVNPDAQIIRTNFFNSDTDLFIDIRDNEDFASGETTPKQETRIEQLRKQQDEYRIESDINNLQSSIINVYNIKTGNLVAQYKGGSPKPQAVGNSQDGNRYVEIVQNIEDELKKIKDQRQSNLQAYLDKLDIVPLSYNFGIKGGTSTLSALLAGSAGFIGAELTDLIVNEDNLTKGNLTNDEFMKERFAIHTFDDSDFFDLLKQSYIRGKYNTSNTKGLSTLIPIKYSFTILGNSGIRRGDVFRIKGIPTKYSERGIFQVTEIEHTLDQGKWTTQISGLFRQIQ